MGKFQPETPCQFDGKKKTMGFRLRFSLENQSIEISMVRISSSLCGCVWKCCVPLCTPLYPMVLLIRQSLWKMAISLAILTQHFQTKPCFCSPFLDLGCGRRRRFAGWSRNRCGRRLAGWQRGQLASCHAVRWSPPEVLVAQGRSAKVEKKHIYSPVNWHRPW